MNTVLILSRVCADFHDRSGRRLFAVTPANRLTFVEAPDSIREDPLFDLLVREGSLEANLTPAERASVESDPLKNTDAAGKKTVRKDRNTPAA